MAGRNTENSCFPNNLVDISSSDTVAPCKMAFLQVKKRVLMEKVDGGKVGSKER